MQNLTTREKVLLVFFLPLFALKVLNITAENISLKLTGIVCFGCFLVFIYNQVYSKRFFLVYSILLCYTGLLVITSGKQAAFFSVVALWLMYKVNMDKRLYRLIFKFGVVFLIIAILISAVDNAETTTRYVNGEWIEMKKRSNILFVSFTAILSLFLLCHRYNLTNKHIMYVAVAGALMFEFVGSRTGLILMVLLLAMLIALKKNFIYNNRIVKWLCVWSPLYCMAFCIYSGLAYEKSPLLLILDMMLQGRLYQNNLFMTRYSLKPFGQHIVEGDWGGEFLNLDCAYLDFLICEGVIFAILWTIVSIAVIRYFYDKKRPVEVAILVMYTYYGITETFLPNCFLNVSLFLYGEYILVKLNVLARVPILKFKVKPK